MKKKISYIFIAFIVSFIFNIKVSAVTSCNYLGQASKGPFYVRFDIEDNGNATRADVSGYIDSTDESYISKETEPVKNWKSKSEDIPFYGKQLNGICPEYAIFIDGIGHFELYVSDESNLPSFYQLGREHQGYIITKLVSSGNLGMDYKINYHANKSGVKGTMDSQYGKNGTALVLSKNKFEYPGYTPVGWMVKNGGKWLCKTNYGNEFTDQCDEDKKIIMGDGALVNIFFSSPEVDLYMKWEVSTYINPLVINQYNLGESVCISKRYVWNETKYGNYCNVDNLVFVGCGDAMDIPSQVPQIISLAINLLKIGTPIVLIFVSIITLVKAMASSKEDEIKKAQTSLVKKIIAAVLVFFVISIVQYVILWVAEDGEADDVSSCFSCMLNNDCSKSSYYKTRAGLGYTCTNIQTGRQIDCETGDQIG